MRLYRGPAPAFTVIAGKFREDLTPRWQEKIVRSSGGWTENALALWPHRWKSENSFRKRLRRAFARKAKAPQGNLPKLCCLGCGGWDSSVRNKARNEGSLLTITALNTFRIPLQFVLQPRGLDPVLVRVLVPSLYQQQCKIDWVICKVTGVTVCLGVLLLRPWQNCDSWCPIYDKVLEFYSWGIRRALQQPHSYLSHRSLRTRVALATAVAFINSIVVRGGVATNR